jgi:GT2 family glycosyltransferase
MKIAVVILNWNGAKLLQQFLPSILRYSPEATIFVADNASIDDSIAVLKTHFPSVQIIQNQDNYGFAKGYNEAMKNLNFDIYALVNSDIEVTENWLQPILDKFKNEPKTAIIQPKILDFKDKTFFEYAGAAGGYIDQYGYPFCRGRIFDTIEKDHQQYEDETEIFWASGACFFIRSEVYYTLQGFDDDFFAHQEEIDLCWRAINRGYHIQYTPKSVVYHVGGATLQQGNPKKTYLNFRNSLLMLVKNLPKSRLLPILFLRLCLDGLAGIQFLFKGKPNHTFAILKAHFSFYYLLPRFYKKREANQIKSYFKTKSVVYFYYIKKQTIFAKNF